MSPKTFVRWAVAALLPWIMPSVLLAGTEVEPNSTISSATLLTAGSQMQGALYDQSDVDYYRLPLTSLQEVTIAVSTTSRETLEMGLQLQVFNASQEKIGGFTSETSQERSTKVVAGPGDIYVSVSKDPSSYYYEGSLTYYLRTTTTGMGTVVTVEVEPNSTISSATLLTAGSQMQGALYDQSDVDYYRLPLTSLQEVTIAVSTTSRETLEMGLQLQVFNASQEKIGGFTSETSQERSTKVVAGPGDIYVSVSKDPSSYYFEGSLTYYLTATGSRAQVANRPPVLAAVGAQTVAEGEPLSVTLSGTDADGDGLSYTVTGSPAGSALSDNTFTWTPGFDRAGTYTVTFLATDSKGGSDSKTVTITVTDVNRAPTLAAIGTKAVAEGSPLSFTLSGSDPDGDALTYAVSGSPVGSMLSGNTFTWAPGYGQAGSYTAAFSVSDSKGGTASESVLITVTATNRAPVLAAVASQTVAEGTALNLVLAGSDPDGDAVTYAVTGNPVGSNLSGSSFAWTPGSGKAGIYSRIRSRLRTNRTRQNSRSIA